jgi:hypothetical protein
MLVGREGLCLFRNPVVVSFSLFRSELLDEIGIAVWERPQRVTYWHSDGVECFVLDV